MTQFVVFLRGINVGGHRKIPMADLRRLLVAKTSDPNVRTYIASGNAVFTAEGDAKDWTRIIAEAIRAEFGFDVPALVLDEAKMRSVLDSCPFPKDAGKLVYGFLCYDTPRLDQDAIAELQFPNEEVAAKGQVVWLHAPDGVGRSKLAARIEKLMGVKATARNLNTVVKMVEMLGE